MLQDTEEFDGTGSAQDKRLRSRLHVDTPARFFFDANAYGLEGYYGGHFDPAFLGPCLPLTRVARPARESSAAMRR